MSLHAEMVLASYLETFTHRPFKKNTYDQIADLAAEQRRIYLQHGILHAHAPWYFSFDRIPFDYEVISTEFERRNLTQNYCFTEGTLIESGAPRLDRITPACRRNGKPPSKKLLFAPSWRSYLVSGNARQRIAEDDVLEASVFYRSLARFMELLTESSLLEDNDLTFELKLHPNFAGYKHLFEFENDRIQLAEDTIDEGSYRLVITDFSSYVFDFVYAGTDVMYFLPDHAEFRAGLNHYSELDWPLEQGFGPYCETPEELLDALCAYLACAPNGHGLQKASAQETGVFLHSDGKNTERLYEEALRIASSLHRA